MDNVGNFIFSCVFYTLTLSSAYVLWKKYFYKHPFQYVFFYGIGVGLVLNEWILVGNHPFNPSVTAIITQISMLSFHTCLYVIPVLVSKDKKHGKKLFFFGVWMTLVIIISLFFKITNKPDLVLAGGIFMTYFIGYNILCIISLRAYISEFRLFKGL